MKPSRQVDPVEKLGRGDDSVIEHDGGLDAPSQLKQLLPDPALRNTIPVLRRIVLEKLTRRRRIRPVGLEDEYRKVHQMVKQTVVAGEGNSLLVIGARGSGKTTVCCFSLSFLTKLFSRLRCPSRLRAELC